MTHFFIDSEDSRTYRPASGSRESTQDTLRRVYDAEGIHYDERMIREDTRAIEQLYKEFGQ